MIKSKFDWDKFKTFYYIAQAGSFTRASEILNTSQPALSRTIQGLEEQIGIKLFTRGSRGVVLTPQGQTLFQSLTRIHQEFIDNELLFQEQKKETDLTLRVGLLRSFVSSELINDISSFIKTQPDIRLSILQFDQASDVFNFKVDVALLPTYESTIDDPLDFTHEYICSFEKRFYASAAYLEQFGTPTTEEELKQHRRIVYSNGAPFMNDTSNKDKSDIESYLYMNSCEAVQKAAEAGYGIAPLISTSYRFKDTPLIEVLPDLNKEETSLFYIYPSCLGKTDKVQRFGAHIKDVLREKGTYYLRPTAHPLSSNAAKHQQVNRI